MSGVSIMGRQVGGACRAGRVIGLSHSGTRLVLPNPADNLIVNGGFEQVRTGWTAIGDGSVAHHHRQILPSTIRMADSHGI